MTTTRDGREFTCTFKAKPEEVEQILAKWRSDNSSLVDDFVANLLKSDS